MKERVLFYLLGIFILGLGVTLTIKVDLGAGAWDALNVGLTKNFGLTVGSWVIIIGIILLFVNAIIVSSKPKYLAAITFVLIGFSVDFWMMNVFDGLEFNSRLTQVFVLFFGIIILALGVAMYLQSNFPANPIDQLMISLHERFNISLMTGKTITELSALVLAFLFKGPIGVGTIIIALLIGPLIQLLHTPIEKVFTKIKS